MGLTGLLAALVLGAVSAEAAALQPQVASTYQDAKIAVTIDTPGLDELSGLAASRIRTDTLWAHNDSFNDPILYAFGTDGRNLGSLRVEGAGNLDWEDMASFVLDDRPYLVIGDIGDNKAVRPFVSLYFFEEPVISGDRIAAGRGVDIEWALHFRYEDGPRDCEALAIDEVGKRILLLSKRTDPPALYELPLIRPDGARRPIGQARRVAELPNLEPPTAMAVSPDGRRAVVQTARHAYVYLRDPDQEWKDAFNETPQRIEMPRMSSLEAATFDRYGRSILVTREKSPQPLVRIDPSAPSRIHGIDLVWHWEGAGASGEHDADVAINPASIVKLATTLWALETLGPDHRFRTTIALRGSIDMETGVLDGDLLVRGGGDPDFHVENAQRVAQRLSELGIRRVTGALYVGEGFWIGWEGGAEGTLANTDARAVKMAQRLSEAWNPRRWSPQTLDAMRRYRDSVPGVTFLHLPVQRVAASDEGPPSSGAVVEHLSNPLKTILKRFNTFSNNDIERLGHHLGGPAAMQSFFRERWRGSQPEIRFETLSGLGSNRMSPRQVTRLIRETQAAAAAHGLRFADLFPTLGCGRNTLRNYPDLLDGLPPGSLVGKTGTLVQTDGGVVTLAGIVRTDRGDVDFFVGAPHNGTRLTVARQAQARWLLDRAREWQVRDGDCADTMAYSYQDADAFHLKSVAPTPD